jgi:hypothetical protein
VIKSASDPTADCMVTMMMMVVVVMPKSAMPISAA